MKTPVVSLFLLLVVLTPVVPALEGRFTDELTCRPVNGSIRLPGVAFDDLTPLALNVFDANPAAVSDALYALSREERDDFLDLYLEPFARERHRLFFSRCRDVAERDAPKTITGGGEYIPERLRAELAERRRVRAALREGAIPFQVGDRVVHIPVLKGYVRERGALIGYLRDAGVADSLAVFGRLDTGDLPGEGAAGRNIIAVIQHVRGGADSFDAVLQAYRAIVDDGWRAVPTSSDETGDIAGEGADYRWNLQPFATRGHSFCYGRFDINPAINKFTLRRISHAAL